MVGNMGRLIEISFSIGLFINAALFIPQGLRILANKDSANVSFTTFCGFWFIQLTTLLHGVLRHDYLLAIGTLISMTTCGFVTYLIIYYRVRNRNVVN